MGLSFIELLQTWVLYGIGCYFFVGYNDGFLRILIWLALWIAGTEACQFEVEDLIIMILWYKVTEFLFWKIHPFIFHRNRRFL